MCALGRLALVETVRLFPLVIVQRYSGVALAREQVISNAGSDFTDALCGVAAMLYRSALSRGIMAVNAGWLRCGACYGVAIVDGRQSRVSNGKEPQTTRARGAGGVNLDPWVVAVHSRHHFVASYLRPGFSARELKRSHLRGPEFTRGTVNHPPASLP